MRAFLLLFFTVLTSAICAQQLPNNSFETWTGTAAKERPVDWNQLNSTLPSPLDAFVPQTCFKETGAHSGTYCARMLTVNTFQGPANGILTTGTIDYNNQTIVGGLPFTFRPDSLVGWYRCNPAATDNGTIEVTLLDNAGDTIGRGKFFTPTAAVSTWTRFSVAVDYYSVNNPDKEIALVSSSNGFTAVVGSEIWADDLELIYNPQSVINAEGENVIHTYYYQNAMYTSLLGTSLTNPTLTVYASNGQVVYQSALQNNEVNRTPVNFESGTYMYSVVSSESVVTGKFVVIR